MAVQEILTQFEARVAELQENGPKAYEAKKLNSRLARFQRDMATFGVDIDITSTQKLLEGYLVERTEADEIMISVLETALVVAEDIGWDSLQVSKVVQLLAAYEQCFTTPRSKKGQNGNTEAV